MTDRPRPWLCAVPWDSVATLNKALCQAQKLEASGRAAKVEAARRLWEKAQPNPLTLLEALQVCHDVHDLAPFLFNNGNTLAAIGCTLVEDLVKRLPPVEAQILRTTIGHFIVGLIGRRELLQVLRHLEPLLTQPATMPAPPETVPAQPPAAVPLRLSQGQQA